MSTLDQAMNYLADNHGYSYDIPTLVSSVVPSANVRYSRVEYYGKLAIITMDITFANSNAKSWLKIGTVSKPPLRQVECAFWGGSDSVGLVRITSEGSIDVVTIAGIEQCRFNMSYIIA